MCEKVKGSWTKGVRVLLSAGLCDDDPEVDCCRYQKRKVILINLVIPRAARNLPEHMSRQPSVQARDSCSIQIPRFARKTIRFVFINLRSILTTRRKRSKIYEKANKKRTYLIRSYGIPSYGFP